MNIYERVKASVTVRDAAEQYGIDVGHSGMALCPFHNDRHPSLYVADDHYYCFACGEHGDVIDLAAKLFDCRLYAAAKRLATDFSVNTEDTDQTPIRQTIPLRLKQAQQFREKVQLCFSVCMDYVRVLADWKQRFAPAGPDDTLDERFVEACHMLDQYEYYTDVLISGDSEERTALVEALTEDDKIEKLQKRMERLRWGEEKNDRNDCAI